jgi:hypothetical protein
MIGIVSRIDSAQEALHQKHSRFRPHAAKDADRSHACGKTWV